MKLGWRTAFGPWLAWVFRVTLAVVFVVASLDKVAHPDRFAVAIANYHLVPQGLINLMAITLPWVELSVGLLLLLGLWVRPGLLLVEGLLSLFIVAILIALSRDLDISCGCFSTDPSAHSMTRWTLYWDIIWLAMGLHALLFDRGLLSIRALLRRKATQG